ncbi:hypothetical protein KZ829_08335 [Actinoplanes hulinensis]|uniref:Uncharacterized protein n=1 Tax=Actinoplanes hulinensis TaxID=1144547 RepID=A0ABS7AYB8_9ACTN|nr:hypothetical protein [Actinoplanes hulinensis]MBW6433750.1 hypothetical protein [Actinoplanes hulinensis]
MTRFIRVSFLRDDPLGQENRVAEIEDLPVDQVRDGAFDGGTQAVQCPVAASPTHSSPP